MRVSRPVLAVCLCLFLGACSSWKTPSELPVAQGSYLLSFHSLRDNELAAVRMGGKVFRINKTVITWDPGGSATLPTGWGLLELEETPISILVKPDGVQVAEVAK